MQRSSRQKFHAVAMLALALFALTVGQLNMADAQHQPPATVAQSGIVSQSMEPARATPLAGGAPSRDEVAQEAHAYLTAWLETGRFSGSVLVSGRGEVLFSRGYGSADVDEGTGNSPWTPYRIGSLSKQFTAAAILRLKQDGLVDLEAPLIRYLPGLAVSEEITLRQLLTHSSGLADYTALPGYPESMATSTGLDELSQRIAAALPLFPPGSGFHYSNSNYVLLAAVVQEVAGMEFDAYLAEAFFTPLGMCATSSGSPVSTTESSACMGRQAASAASGYIFTGDDYARSSPIHLSQAIGAGGVTSTTADLLTWAKALLSAEVLTEESRDSMLGRHIAAGSSASGAAAHYGYGWFRSSWRGGRDLVSHGGGINGFSSQLMIFPAQELVVVVLGNLDGAPAREVADGLAAIALGEPYTLPRVREAVDLAPGTVEPLAGQYALGPATVIEVVADSGRLYLNGPGLTRFRLFPASENHFFLRNAEVELQFVTGDTGEVLGVVLHQGGARLPARRLEYWAGFGQLAGFLR